MTAFGKLISKVAVAAVLSVSVSSAFAAEGDKLVRFGLVNVNPNDGSSGVVADDAIGVDDGSSLYINGVYMYRDNMGIELLAALPFSHDITLDGVGKIAETDHLPPTLSVTYHFGGDAAMRPYVGIGVNYTTFFDERATSTITDIELEDSWGLALQAGFDYDINDKWFLNASLRYIDITTTAETNIGDIDVDIDPWVLSIGVGTAF